jgi:hypothetical protein
MEYIHNANNTETFEIKNELDIISTKIENLENKMNLLLKYFEKMDKHINFIENTYNNIRNPINFIKNKIEFYIGDNIADLPAIEAPINNQ